MVRTHFNCNLKISANSETFPGGPRCTLKGLAVDARQSEGEETGGSGDACGNPFVSESKTRKFLPLKVCIGIKTKLSPGNLLIDFIFHFRSRLGVCDHIWRGHEKEKRSGKHTNTMLSRQIL